MSNAKKRTHWSEEDEQVLIDLWAERANDLGKTKRNRHIYLDISSNFDHKFTGEEIHTKIRNLTQRYRLERKGGGSQAPWKHYNAVHQIMSHNTSNNAEVCESFSFVSPPQESQLSTSELDIPLEWELKSEPPQSPHLTPSASPVPLQSSSPTMRSGPLSSPVKLESPSPTIKSGSSKHSPPSKRKKSNMSEVLKLMKQQNKMLKSVVEDTQSLSNEIVKSIQQQNETAKEFVNLMKSLIEKI